MSTNTASFHLQQDQQQVLCLNWEEIDGLTHQLARAICAEGKPDVLIGLQRGGVIPAVMLSHQLALPDLLALPIRRTLSDAIYASKQAPTVQMPEHFLQLQGKDLVIVDDIVGSGETLRAALQVITPYAPARVRSVVCVVNRAHWDPVNQHEPHTDIFAIGREVRGWVVFPWETAAQRAQGFVGEQSSREIQGEKDQEREEHGNATQRT